MYIRHERRGSIVVFSLFLLVALFILAAFTVNIGNLVNHRAEMQNIADASVKSAAWTMAEEFGNDNATEHATNSAKKMVEISTQLSNVGSIFLEQNDAKYGRLSWNKTADQWETSWNSVPTNLVRISLDRNPERSNAIEVFLAPFTRKSTLDMSVNANAAMFPATGFEFDPKSGENLPIIPLAIDLDSWVDLEKNGNKDDFGWNEDSKLVGDWSDGLPELKIFPLGTDSNLPSGNRATLALGGSNNSAAKLGRQIREGLSAADMSFHGNGFSVAEGPLYLEGDPGISASIESDLKQIIGETRIVALFTEVRSPGANSVYTIVKFVGVRIMNVDLRGAKRYKQLVLQPANVIIDQATSNGKMPLLEDELGTVFQPPTLIWTDN